MPYHRTDVLLRPRTSAAQIVLTRSQRILRSQHVDVVGPRHPGGPLDGEHAHCPVHHWAAPGGSAAQPVPGAVCGRAAGSGAVKHRQSARCGRRGRGEGRPAGSNRRRQGTGRVGVGQARRGAVLGVHTVSGAQRVGRRVWLFRQAACGAEHLGGWGPIVRRSSLHRRKGDGEDGTPAPGSHRTDSQPRSEKDGAPPSGGA